MLIDVEGASAHVLTGGAAFDRSLPCIVFLHGAGMDASVWSLQSRWFAHHGYGVLAFDLPGHGRSEGPPLVTIDTMADWIDQALGTLGVTSAAVVGHSMGSLIALSLAARHTSRVERLALIGTAFEMKVGPDLLAAAAADSPDAHAMVNLWGHGVRAGLGGCESPGVWMVGSGLRLLEKAADGILSNDLRACNACIVSDYVAKVTQPVLILQGSRDAMTPLKGARILAHHLVSATLKSFDDAGHMLMIEEAGRVLSVLAKELAKRHPDAPTLTQPVGAPP